MAGRPAPSKGEIAMAPAARIDALVKAVGDEDVTTWAGELLLGRVRPDDPGRPSILWLGGAHAKALTDDRKLDDPTHEYWIRVWAARALLHQWSPAETGAVLNALSDQAWRVREMCAKVVRKYELGEAAMALGPLLADDQARVRAAAALALGEVGEAEHADALLKLEDDPDQTVASAAARALAKLEERLDRPLR